MDIAPCKGMQICRIRKFLLVESGIRKKFCLWNPEQAGSWNPEYSTMNPKFHLSNDWNPESKFYRQHWNRMPGTWNPESTAWNPETKTVLDSH